MKYLISPAFFLVLVLAVTAQDKFNPYQYSISKHFTGANGAVVAAHPLASQVGVMILRKGGNAVDAAIATQLALAVVYPGAGNIGGGGFMVIHLSGGKDLTLDFREKAPLKGSRDMYLDANGNADLNKSQHGHLAAGVPGAVAGIFKAMPYARLPFKQLIQPAIDLAAKGFVITGAEAADLNDDRELFVKNNTRPTAFVKDIPWKAGDTLVQKELAETLIRIRDQGKKGFYEGKTARLIVAEMDRGKGMISLEDLKKYDAVWRDASVFEYKGHRVVTMPLPSSGGVLLPMMMKMTARFPIDSFGFHTPKSVQLMTEIERLAYADRAKFLGDPDFYAVPVKTLLSDDYITSRLRLYQPDTAGDSRRIASGDVTKESEETTHLSVADKEGNAVSLTTTLNGGYGSHTVVGGAGFLLNNEMDDFSVKPGVPNMYGAVGGEANAIAPGKRMLSSMTPVIVLRSGKPVYVTGTPGGTTITTSLYQTLLNLIDFKLSALDAVNQPKFHMQWLPDTLYVEKEFPEALKATMERMGYKVNSRGHIGRTELIVIDNGKIEAVGDFRGDDTAAGY
ncbi:gamma-glutamyltransferase [Flavihumibacter petaseus]|uniref:Glutathione hydrolase proenzyme n=1 Tax=Flavihumibacter petaseus NBRC 106054 TaxID=1220578 RepID=A0A0E9N002_9BACT|nr:gamma-glutamyltransferase [Flavihumibacter petaseus]GAO42956.1 gamma-glutamyltranspeptidase [Flavihumibacter petaseus NBRC 106054]